MRESLDGVGVFVEAVEAGSFSRAAERLALTRSAVGKTIARLEERLGVRLFHRTTRTQSLTEEGHIYYERCLKALEELHQGKAFIESGRREVAGRLKVSVPLLFGRYCVAPVLIGLARAHPALELDLRFSDQIIDVIADGFDLAVRNGHRGDGGGLHSRKIADQRKIFCASPAYLQRRGRPQDMSELSDHDAIVYWRNNTLFPWRYLDDAGGVAEAAPKWRLQFDSQEAIADAAAAGMGIANVPSWLVHERLEQGQLVTILDHIATPPLEAFAVWPSAPYLPMRLRAAIDILAEELQALVDP